MNLPIRTGLASRLALAAIRAYQRHLCPRKGFFCAYRCATGRDGCSAYGYRVIARFGGCLPDSSCADAGSALDCGGCDGGRRSRSGCCDLGSWWRSWQRDWEERRRQRRMRRIFTR